MEERISTVRDSDSLPFSFFRESFDRIQEIYRTLHLLEFLQIDDMRGQMERLVHFLSEVENKDAREKDTLEKDTSEKSVREKNAREEPKKETIVPAIPPGAGMRDIEFPEYRNPRAHEHASVSKASLPGRSTTGNEELPVPSPAPSGQKGAVTVPLAVDKTRAFKEPAFVEGKSASLNDIIPSRTAVVDLKRRISLNDRFLFQRELFGNSRQEMDRAMEQLSKLQTYAEAETYLRESLSLDLENATVSDFLHVIKQGFE